MATQNKDNVVLYEFQGNTLPLEKAFAQVGKLFRRYIREAKAAEKTIDPENNPKGKLSDDAAFLAKELKNNYKRLKYYSDKAKAGYTLSDEEVAETKRIFKKIQVATNKFHKQRDIVQRKADKAAKIKEEKQRETKDWTAISTQFKAGVQAEQLHTLTTQLPHLDPRIAADIDSYVEAWKLAKKEFDGSATSTERLAVATKNLDTKAREYSATLKTMIKNQKSATDAMSTALSRIINMISSFEWWYRIIREGITLLGDYVESLNFIEVAINNIKWDSLVDGAKASQEALENLTEAFEQARWSLGLNATDTNTAAATYISFANAMNMTGESVAKFGQNMTQLSIDMASLYNKDTIVMMTALRSGLAGNTRALMNYGISVHDATLNEWMYAKGLNKTMNELSETSQMMVRYMYIMEKTTAAQGDLNRTLKSPANQIRVLRNQLKLLMQNIGALCNLFIYPAIRLINEFLIPLNAFISALTSLTDNNYSSAIGSTSDSFDDLADSIDDTSNAAKGLSSLDEINQMADRKNTRIGIDADIQALFDSIEVYDNFNKSTSELVKVMKSLGEALAPVWQMLSDTSVLDGVAWCLNAIGYALKPIQLILDGFREWFGTWPKWLQDIFNVLGKINGVFAGLATTILVAAAAMAVFKTLTQAKVFENFIGIIAMMIKEFKALGATIWTNVIKPLITFIATQIREIFIAYKQAMANWMLEGTYWKLSVAMIAAGGVMAAAIAAIVMGAVASGNATANANKSISKPGMSGVAGLATGGVVTKPTFALVGEGKYDEAVMPLGNSPQMAELQRGIAEQVVRTTNITNNNGYQGGNASVQLNIDGRSLGRATINNIGLTRRQVGVDIK